MTCRSEVTAPHLFAVGGISVFNRVILDTVIEKIPIAGMNCKAQERWGAFPNPSLRHTMLNCLHICIQRHHYVRGHIYVIWTALDLA